MVFPANYRYYHTVGKPVTDEEIFDNPILLIVVSVFRFIFNNRLFDYVEFLIMLATFALLIGMVMVKVFEPGSITIHRVIGSILAYMLIGNVWAQMFQFIFIHMPGSLQVPDLYTLNGVPNSVFLYFSYTTLTTTGYGEILPVQRNHTHTGHHRAINRGSLPCCTYRKAGIACY